VTRLLFVFLAAALPALAADPRVPVRIAVDTTGATARVVITSDQAVSWSVRGVTGAIEVSCGAPLDVAETEKRVGDAILAGYKVLDGRTIVLETGSGFRRHQSFELKNPSRLILDLEGERAGAPGAATSAPASQRRSVIVVDPGHGGVEEGAIGATGLKEKDVTLDLARRLKAALEREAPVSVVLTRDEDRVVPLDERTAIANHNRAELFVSVHLNASKRKSAVGAETYFLSADATDDDARTLAALENRAQDGAKPSAAPPVSDGSGLDMILWDMAQNQHLAESGRLAESVQRELNALAGTKDRGVRQAPFTVLMGATSPAILIEAGFVSNPEEEARFKDDAYKDRVVQAIVRAVLEFRRGLAAADGKAEAP
jgi:N-acetylmuramoyl-L-alanine amidase